MLNPQKYQRLTRIWRKKQTLHRERVLISNFSNVSRINYDKYCLDMVQKNDYEHYLIGLLLPRKQRAAYFALRAFNVEVAQIKDHVRGNIAASRLRFQYWRNIFDYIFEESAKSSTRIDGNDLQPIAMALQSSYPKSKWSYSMFQRYLEGR
jgi:phytoene/squalene synthetase